LLFCNLFFVLRPELLGLFSTLLSTALI
jgi:hypothetical protein